MPVNIEEIKKLSDLEKLRLIDELLASVNESVIDEYLADTEDNTLNERLEIYHSGKMKFDSWENVEKRLREKSRLRRERNKDDLQDLNF